MMSLGVIAAIAYGLLAIIGGIVGYTKAKSKISLFAGCTTGLLLVLGGILQIQGLTWGLIFSIVLSVFLIITFISRLFKTRKFMPSGLMIIAGFVALALMGYQMQIL
ncbi:TMEM14 family protein [Planktothrix sp. FACHB-1365]|uniref:TMEM14 family protein n=1 Tax=Planktothrix sp. FACHB-1365 TaxID=2692855 RepID=UPI0035CD258A